MQINFAAQEPVWAREDSMNAAIAAKLDAFTQHGGLWAAGRYYTLDDVHEAVHVQPEYVAWWQRKQHAEGRQQEVIGLEFKTLWPRLVETAMTNIATLAVIDEQEDAA